METLQEVILCSFALGQLELKLLIKVLIGLSRHLEHPLEYTYVFMAIAIFMMIIFIIFIITIIIIIIIVIGIVKVIRHH